MAEQAPAPETPIDANMLRTEQVEVAAPKESIGILFVHGMGEQQRGGTLQGWAEPLVQWVRRWDSREFNLEYVRQTEPAPGTVGEQAAGAPASTADAATASNIANSPLGYTIIRGEPVNRSAYEPATTELSMSRPDAVTGAPRSATWVMAEAWWADAFYPPPFSDVAKWGLGVGPRFVVRHFELKTGGLAGKPQSVRYAAALALVLLLEIAVVGLLVVGAIPFARNYVRSIILRLIGSIGDPMVLVASPLRSAALSTAVRNSLNWLRDTRGCSKVAVIAHSLGTVVSYNVLSTNSSGVDLYVTFGAALKKTNLLQRVQNNDVRLSLGVVLAVGAFLSFALATSIATWFWIDEQIARFDRHLLGWTWPNLLVVAGATFCIARLALWRTDGPRFVAPAGCAVAIAGAIAFLAFRPTATSPVPFDTISFAPVREMLASWDILRLIPFVAAMALAAWRERHDARILGSGDAAAIQRLEATDHPLYMGSLLIQSLLVAGAWVTCVTQWWRPPEFITPLAVTGLVLAWSAIRVPFGNGYLPGDREQTIVPFNFATTTDGGQPLEWRDYLAWKDPVPEGRFVQENVGLSPRPVLLTSTEVTNQQSVLSDHTAYHRNLEEFVGSVVERLCALSGWASPWQRTEDAAVVEAAQERRRVRVRTRGRTVAVMLVAVLALMAFMSFQQLAALTSLGNAALTPLMGLLNLILSDDLVEDINHLLSGAMVGLLVIALAAYLWQRFVSGAAWYQWERAEQSAMFHRIALRDGNAPGWVRWRRLAFIFAGAAMPLIMATSFAVLVARGTILGG